MSKEKDEREYLERERNPYARKRAEKVEPKKDWETDSQTSMEELEEELALHQSLYSNRHIQMDNKSSTKIGKEVNQRGGKDYIKEEKDYIKGSAEPRRQESKEKQEKNSVDKIDNVDNTSRVRREGRPNVDKVDNFKRVPQGLGARDINRINEDELDLILGIEEERREEFSSLQSPTRLLDPTPVIPGKNTPSGPSDEAMQAIRAAAHKRLGERSLEEGTHPAIGAQPSRMSPSGQARNGTTVNQSTLNQYLRRGQQLFDRYKREIKVIGEGEVNPVEFVNWLLALKTELKSNTWRMYRQSSYHWIEGIPSQEAERALELLDNDIIDRSRNIREEDDDEKPSSKKTSANKEKRFPRDDYERVITYLTRFNRSRIAPALADWLRAGLLTGLRPIEWRATDLQEQVSTDGQNKVYLYVLNAKATNGRGTGVVRTLDISEFNGTDIDCVRRMVERSRTWLLEDRYSTMKGQCSALLYATTNKLWPSRRYAYALYSCRHQAIANWKAILQTDEIAALAGHGVTATAAEHYGKKRSSWPIEHIPQPPKCVAEELSGVRQTIKIYEDRVKLEQAAGLRRDGEVPEFPIG